MSGALTGESLIAGERRWGGAGEIRAVEGATGAALDPVFSLADADDAAAAAAAAAAAFEVYRAVPPAKRAALLRAIADGLDADVEALVARATLETGLPNARLTGEVARTSGQLRMFADALGDGRLEGIRIDSADPGRTPAPRPEIRQRRVPLGPVVVFGASNFPFAFSNAGGDTAAALAAGCPVIVKSHQAHPGVAELVSGIVATAVAEQKLPAGVYQALMGSGREVGARLVADARIRAVGFTGSRAGGIALMRIAGERPVPIPVYAEMSSVNPVVVLPTACTAATAEGFVASLTLGAGQFCTNPGLVFVPAGDVGDTFVDAAATAVRSQRGQRMLTPGICEAYTEGQRALFASADEVALGEDGGAGAPAPGLAQVSVQEFVERPALLDEVFGATALIVRYDDDDALRVALRRLDGQLTATLHIDLERCSDAERATATELVSELELVAGRVLMNGWPTGVEVGHAIVHGGPFPATSDGRSTSVGSLAIERFQRPVAYQNIPEPLLPEVLRNDSVARSVRLEDGVTRVP